MNFWNIISELIGQVRYGFGADSCDRDYGEPTWTVETSAVGMRKLIGMDQKTLIYRRKAFNLS